MILETADTKISVQDQIDAAKYIIDKGTSVFTSQNVTDAKAKLVELLGTTENTGP